MVAEDGAAVRVGVGDAGQRPLGPRRRHSHHLQMEAHRFRCAQVIETALIQVPHGVNESIDKDFRQPRLAAD